MRKQFMTLSCLVLITTMGYSQEVKQTKMYVFGQLQTLNYIEVDGKKYILWNDLESALPAWFEKRADGALSTSERLAKIFLLGLSGYSSSSGDSGTGETIESRIDGDFEGWDGESIYKLTNGQIWQQDEYKYKYTYKYSPRVTIYRKSGSWVMLVDGMSDAIRVKRLN